MSAEAGSGGEWSSEEIELAERLYKDWSSGARSKSQIEREEWGDGRSHGRRFDRYVQTRLGVQTSKKSKQSSAIERLTNQLLALGSVPDGLEISEDQAFLFHSRSAALQGIRIWNDPASDFKVASFSLLFVAAWNSLCIAILEGAGKGWTTADGKAKATRELVRDALGASGENRARFENIALWNDIRDAVAHRRTPQLEVMLAGEAQAGLLNYEEAIKTHFGPGYGLAEKLVVPLQLSGLRDPGVLKSRKLAEGAIPPPVLAILNRSKDQAYESAPEFRLAYVFLPTVPRSGRSADAQVVFAKPEDVPDELRDALDRYVVLDKPYARRAQLRPSQVVNEVKRRTGWHFQTVMHADAARSLGARPPKGEGDRTIKLEWAEYIPAHKHYLYTQAWVDHLVQLMSDTSGYESVTGKPAKQAVEMGGSPA